MINNISEKCKLIFPSTHVVYEGFNDTKLELTEDEPTKPFLTYAIVKNRSEIDIKEKHFCTKCRNK